MSETEFTPGPYEVVNGVDYFHIRSIANWRYVAKCPDDIQGKRDSKLLAASSDMYAALEEVLEQIGGETLLFDKCFAALKKARGV